MNTQLFLLVAVLFAPAIFIDLVPLFRNRERSYLFFYIPVYLAALALCILETVHPFDNGLAIELLQALFKFVK